jgi:DNA-binding Lrp family transcriptional regulator
MYTSLEDRKKVYRLIYEAYYKTPRIKIKRLSKELKSRPSDASRRVKEAIEQGYIVGPHIRKMSFLNFKEIMYFVKCEDPIALCKKLKKNKYVIYHELLDGFADVRIITTKEIDIDGEIVLKGVRSDYLISFAPLRTWIAAIKIIQKMIQDFDPAQYVPQGLIETHWDEPIEWDEQDEILYKVFKYGLRKPLTPLMVKYHISKDKITQWLKRLSECCTVYTCYFPESIDNYDSYIFMFETDYVDFIVELFSQLPTTVWFFTVADKLFVYLWVERGSMKNVNFRKPKINNLQIPLIVRDLLNKGIIKSKAHAAIQYFWRKELDDY